jgi:protein-disulfide isomerase
MAALVSFLILLLAPPSAVAQSPDQRADDCGCSAERPEILAVVGDVKITAAEVEAELQKRGDTTWQDVEDMRQRTLKFVVRDRLIEAEARRRGMALSALLAAEVYSNVKEPTTAELRELFAKSNDAVKVGFDAAKPDLVETYRDKRIRVELDAFGERLGAALHVRAPVKLPPPPASARERATVVVTFDGGTMNLGEVEDSFRSLLYAVRYDAYTSASAILEEKIADALIAREAARRGMILDAFVAAEVTPKVVKVTPADVSAYYEKNPLEFVERPLPTVEAEIEEKLRHEALVGAKRACTDAMRGAANVQIYLAEPPAPSFAIDVTDRPVRGNPSAEVTVVEFADFECPHCAAAQPMIEELLRKYGDRIRVVACAFPMPTHANAFRAAEAAAAAGEQGKYWEYAALLFERSSSLSDETFAQLASRLGLDRARFDAALASGKLNARVARDLHDGWRLGVVGTPWFFVNGKVVANSTPDGMRAAIDAALRSEPARRP